MQGVAVIDYRVTGWGHTCALKRDPKQIHESGAPIYTGHMFYGDLIFTGREVVQVGTELIIKMASGRPVVLQLTEVRPAGDPLDMYFISAYPVRYLEEEG
jgi:hypothetical protein